jgi:hypothetical protein
MKRIATSAGLIALGAMSAGTAQAQDETKPWNLSGVLRAFYDDNWNTAASGTGARQGSYGFEVSPGLGYKIVNGPTEASLSYTYGLKYFESRPSNNADHSHAAEAKLRHTFPERYKLDISDSFVSSQEPGVLDPASLTVPFRSNGNNIRNTVALTLGAELTPTFSLDIGYSNSFYDYQETGTDSRSALLDRVEHLARVDLRWAARSDVIGIFGYQFGFNDQTSADLVTTTAAPPGQSASVRDARSHYVYIGADRNFSPQLLGSVRAGLQYTDYPNAPAPLVQNSTSPYVDFAGTWAYSPEGTIQLGLKHTRNQTDVSSGAQDAESTTIYGNLSHNIAAVVKTSVLVQYQNSSFRGGLFDTLSDNIFMLGVNASYDVIKNRLTAEMGYNYDRVDSDITLRSLYRHRVYIGLKATY